LLGLRGLGLGVEQPIVFEGVVRVWALGVRQQQKRWMLIEVLFEREGTTISRFLSTSVTRAHRMEVFTLGQ
jgi:hypothetical protein